MSQANTLSPGTHEIVGARTPRIAALAAWIGSALEYYDFFIYGTASALVFPKIFFSSSDPQMATIASFATFGVAYVARPFGAVVLGHVGDRFGRKKVLIFTLMVMGISTLAFRASPTAALVVNTPSATMPCIPAMISSSLRPRSSSTPRLRLRDSPPVQVSTRSPNPDRPRR